MIGKNSNGMWVNDLSLQRQSFVLIRAVLLRQTIYTPSKPFLNYVLIFDAEEKHLKPNDIRNQSDILAHTNTLAPEAQLHNIRVVLSWPTLSALMRSEPAPTLATTVFLATVLMSGWGDKQTSAAIWRGGAGSHMHQRTNARGSRPRSCTFLQPVRAAAEQRVWQPHKKKELRKSRSGVTSPCLPHQWVIVAPPPAPPTLLSSSCTLQPNVGPSPFRRRERPASLSNEVE